MFQDNFEANETLSDVFNPDNRFGGGFYYRYALNMVSGTMSREQVVEQNLNFRPLTLRYAQQRNHHTHTACSIPNQADSFFNGIAKIDDEGGAETYLFTLDQGFYGSEPVFAPRVGGRRDDGYVLGGIQRLRSHQRVADFE